MDRELTAESFRPAPPPSSPLSLVKLLDQKILADPYPLYRALREHDPVMWDSFLHCWVITGYADVKNVLLNFSADRTPTPEQLRSIGLSALEPMAELMVRQMLFMDPPMHTRLRGLCSAAFTPRRVEKLQARIQEIADTLIDRVADMDGFDLIADFAAPLPAIVTAELLGVPVEDHLQLKQWTADFAEMLGNFQHNPDRVTEMVRTVTDMTAYFRSAVRAQAHTPREGLIQALMIAEVDGSRLSEDEVVASTIVTMVGGQETTTNLIGNGMLTLMRQPEKMADLRDHPEIIESAVEELLRYESPSQHTGRIVPEDVVMGGKTLKKRDAVMVVMAAGNRDPDMFPEPDVLDLRRTNNRHLAFGWAAHFCFGAPLARMEGQIAFSTLLRRFDSLSVASRKLVWRDNSGLRGLVSLPVRRSTTA